MKRALQYVAAELTLVNGRFERDMAVGVQDGVIVSVQPTSTVDSDSWSRFGTSSSVLRLPHRALIPGMVSSHSHAFQRALRGRGETYRPLSEQREDFWSWRQAMYAVVDEVSSDPSQFYSWTRRCFEEMRAGGITTVGEFHYFHHSRDGSEGKDMNWDLDGLVMKAAEDAGIRLVLLQVYYQRGGFDGAALNDAQQRFACRDMETFLSQVRRLTDKAKESARRSRSGQVIGGNDAELQAAVAAGEREEGEGGQPEGRSLISVGVAAHSLRAVDLDDLGALLAHASSEGIPCHVHVEEQPQEVADCKAAHDGATPMALLNAAITKCNSSSSSSSASSRPVSVTSVHSTWTTPEDMARFIALGGNVSICPLTEGNLGDGFPPIGKGIDLAQVSLGSDCNARIDMAEEMRWLEYAHRLHQNRRGVCLGSTHEGKDVRVPVASQLFKVASSNGAAALGLNAGEIAAGQLADFATLDLDNAELFGWTEETLLESFIFGASGPAAVAETCVGGHWRVAKVDMDFTAGSAAATADNTPEAAN